MCGVAAIFAYHPSAPPVDRDELVRIRDSMKSKEIKDLITDLNEMMREAAGNLEFELAAELRDKIRELEQTLVIEKNS